MLVGSNALLLFLWAASGLALFNGKALGWWLAAFLYPHGMFRFGRMFYVESRSASDADPPRLIAH